MKIIYLFLFLLLASEACFADYAVITKIRGKVFLEASKDQKRTLLKEQDKVFSGQSIYTMKKSIVRVKFVDGSTMTVGQNSHFVLKKIEVGQTNYVSLMNGYLRAKFSKSKTEQYKIIVNTKTAGLGVRGTEFNIIYNKDNNITTAISFSGDVEFSSAIQDQNKFASDKVSLMPGQFSTTLSKDDYVSNPVKMSPRQFDILRNNDDLKTRKKIALKKNKEQAVLPPKKTSDETSLEVPRELLGDGHGQVSGSIIEDTNAPRPGGYIDLKTGIYIEPPEGAKYNEKEGVFDIPKEFGGIDPETGEYVPPLGIILHPLKGFVVASSTIESGVKYVREKVTSGVIDAGEIVVDGISGIGSTLENKTGVMGKTVGKGVRVASKAAMEGAKKTGTFFSDNTLKSLNVVANNMNSYLYYGALEKIGSTVKKVPLISKLDLQVSDKFGYSTNQRFQLYNYVTEVVKAPTFHNDLHFLALYKKTFWKKIFVRPKFSVDKKNHLRDHISEVRGLDNYKYKYGVDVGIVGKIKGVLVQTYFYSDFTSQHRFDSAKQSYEPYLKDKRFGFSKLIMGKKHIASKFDYSYTKYRSHYFQSGDMHDLSLSEIINLDNKNFLNFKLYWSYREEDSIDNDIDIYGAKLAYFLSSKVNHFKVSTWLDFNTSKDQQDLDSRGREYNLDVGVRLIKNFPRFFSTSFDYLIKDIDSHNSDFDGSTHTASLAFNVSY